MAKVGPFEKYARRYESWFEANRFAYESEILAIRHILPRGQTGIEIGVGTGRFALPFAIRIGVDPSLAMGRIARKKGVTFIGAVAESLPLRNRQFDFALMVTAVCFLDDVGASFTETNRVLRAGGHLIIGFIDRSSALGRKYEEHKKESAFYGEATFYSVEEITSCLEKAGFGKLVFVQTMFRNPSELERPEPVEQGHGKGSFVAVRAMKLKEFDE